MTDDAVRHLKPYTPASPPAAGDVVRYRGYEFTILGSYEVPNADTDGDD